MSEQNGHHGEAAIDEIHSLPIPQGWTKTNIAAVGEVRLGRQRSPKNRSADHPTKYLRAANITWSGIDLSDVLDMEFRPAELKTYRLHPGDILLSEASGSASEVGKPAIWNGELEDCCVQNTVIRFRPKAVDPKFALVAFQHFARNAVFSRVAKGVGIHHLSADRFASMPFLLPPQKEQRRIVEKIEELFTDLDVGVAALERSRANLKRYRASVLKAAAEGSLTSEWRANHPKVEPASKLLERILEERRRHWEADQLAKFVVVGIKSKNWQAKYVEPAHPDTSNMPELPQGWCWATLGQLLHGIEGGKSFKCLSRQATPDEWGVIKVSAMTWGTFLEDEQKAIPPGIDFDRAHEIRPSDLLLSRSNTTELVGATVLVRECRRRLLLSDKSLRLLVSDGLNRRWLHNSLSSSVARGQLSAMATGTSDSMRNVSQEKIESVVLPLPPLVEQRQIVDEVEHRLSLALQSQSEVEPSLLRAARLRRSILKQAFEGKLIAQDASDEPAPMLIARMQQRKVEPTDRIGQKSTKRRKLSNDVFMRRACVVSYAVRRLAESRSFGRTQLEKTIHLAQSHIGIELEFTFERYAAGPFDKHIYKLEGVARKNDWFTTRDRAGFGVTYQPGNKIEMICSYAAEYLGSKEIELNRLLDQMARMTSDQAELLSTTYAAWNDLLIDGRSADDEAIAAEIYGWHEQKQKFSSHRIQRVLQWMREHGYVPTGQGQRTRVLSRPTTLLRRRKSARGRTAQAEGAE